MLGLVNRSTGYSCVSVRVLRSKACGALKRQSHPTRAVQVTAKDFVGVCVCVRAHISLLVCVSVLHTITIVVKQSHQQHMHAHIHIRTYVYVFTQEHNNRKRAMPEASVLSLFILYIKYYLPKWSTTILMHCTMLDLNVGARLKVCSRINVCVD